MSDDDQPGASWLRRITRAFATEPRDRDELVNSLADGRRRGFIDGYEFAMLQGVLNVSQTQVRDVMIPRSQMAVVTRDDPPESILRAIIDSGHSRFPVIGEDKDEVIGILFAKDLLRFFVEGDPRDFDIRECLRAAVFIPESKRLNVLLREFRTTRNHMAIVVDEYGGVAGLLTIEDVLEQIVGEIDDEHDVHQEALIQSEGDQRYSVSALVRIWDFNEHFGTEFRDEEYDTVGGLVIHELGRLPRRGESITFGGFEFKVTRADRRRIERLSVTVPGDGPRPEDNTSG